MSLQQILKILFVPSLIALVAAGGLIAWTSALHAADEAGKASTESVRSDSRGDAASVTAPASIPRGPNPQINFNAQLIGTAVVQGGPSIAFLQLATGTRFVREGDEIVAGVRLVKVWRNRIDIEAAGVHQELRPGSSEVPQDQVSPGPMRAEAAQGDVDRLWETQGRNGRSLFYTHYRRPQNQ